VTDRLRPASPAWRRILAFLVLALTIGVRDAAHPLTQSKADPRRFVGVTFSATVTSIVDGDTVHVALSDGRALTIRLDGIDCPETGESFSTQARNATRVMLFTKRAQLKGTDVDRYSRLVARVSVDGVDSSIELVKAGLACHFTRYSSDQQLAAAQRSAQQEGRGFWSAGVQRPTCTSATRQRNAPVRSGPFHGNTLSRVFHHPSCRNYNCRNCIETFATADAAVTAGYKPAGDCLR
jgi:endonuclease YncB( thermonuclease family)